MEWLRQAIEAEGGMVQPDISVEGLFKELQEPSRGEQSDMMVGPSG